MDTHGCRTLALWLGASFFGAASSAEQFVAVPSLDFKHTAGTADKPYILETMGSGVALFDYDMDGDLDLYFVTAGKLDRLGEKDPGEPNRLFRNEGDWRFTDVTDLAGIADRGFGQGVAVADVDNDGDSDVYVTNYGPNAFYRNNGDGTFTRTGAGVEDPRWSTSAAFGDVDSDGFVDLYGCNYLDFDREQLDRLIPRRHCVWKGLKVQCGPQGFGFVSGVLYHNRGDGTFEDWTDRAGVRSSETYQLGAVFSDLDLDGDQDLYVSTDTTVNLLYQNQGDGRFEEVSLFAGVGLSQNGMEQAGMGIDVGDVNQDGLFDIFVTNFAADYNTLYLNQGELRFVDATDVADLGLASLSYLGWSTRLADLDADGDLDIIVVNGHVYPQVDDADIGESFRQPMQVFLNRGDGTFEEEHSELGTALSEPRASRGAGLGDLDGDLMQDIVVNVMDQAPVLMRNELAGTSRTVVLRLVGRQSNRDGIGAILRAEIGEKTLVREVRGDRGYLSHSDSRVYFGLGEHEKIDRLEIRWPSGETSSLADLLPGAHTVVE